MHRCAGVGLRRTSHSATKRATALGGVVRKRRAAPTTRRKLERDWLARSRTSLSTHHLMSVRRIYGYPGDGIDSIATTLRKEIGTEEGEAGSHKVV